MTKWKVTGDGVFLSQKKNRKRRVEDPLEDIGDIEDNALKSTGPFKVEDGNVNSNHIDTGNIVGLVKHHALLAEGWLKKNKTKLVGKWYAPIALTRIDEDDDLREKLEKIYKRPTDDWCEEEDVFFNSAWSFSFTSKKDICTFLDELKDNQNLVLYAELIN